MTFLFILVYIFLLAVNTYVFNTIITNFFDFKNKYFSVGLSFLISTSIIAVSIALELKWFWVILHIIALLIFLKIKNFSKSTKIPVSKDNFFLILVLLLHSVFIYFQDSFKFISMNHPDNFANYQWAIDNLDMNGISYSPGLTGLAALVIKVFDLQYMLNIVGSVLGITSFIAILIVLRTVFNLNQLIVLTSILLSPIFNSLSIVRIGFHAGPIFQLCLISFLIYFYVSIEDVRIKNSLQINSFFYFLIFYQAGIVSPHQTLTLIPLAVILLLCMLIFKKINFVNLLLRIFFILLGFYLSIIYIDSQKIKSIYDITSNNSESILISRTTNLSIENIYLNYFIDFINPTLPIRPIFESYLSLFSYILIIPIILLLYRFYKSKNIFIFIISISTLYYLLVTQTGILELSFTKGRSGWNLMILSSILFITLIGAKIKKLNNLFTSGIVLLSFISSMFLPPKVYRYESEQALIEIKQIALKSQIFLYSDFVNRNFISKNVVIIDDLNDSRIFNPNSYVLLSLSTKIPDLFKANIRKFEDRDFESFFLEQKYKIDENLQKNMGITRSLTAKGFNILIENKDFIILKYKSQE
jgi:hypothetical protein